MSPVWLEFITFGGEQPPNWDGLIQGSTSWTKTAQHGASWEKCFASTRWEPPGVRACLDSDFLVHAKPRHCPFTQNRPPGFPSNPTVRKPVASHLAWIGWFLITTSMSCPGNNEKTYVQYKIKSRFSSANGRSSCSRSKSTSNRNQAQKQIPKTSQEKGKRGLKPFVALPEPSNLLMGKPLPFTEKPTKRSDGKQFSLDEIHVAPIL